MRRREFIALVGSGVAGWPLAVSAQQPGMPVVGFLLVGTPELNTNQVAAFRAGLSETGYTEGQNVAVQYVWARNEFTRLPELAADLVNRRVAVIAYNGDARVLAGLTTIPIVFNVGVDPVQAGIVTSFNRPGANITGVTTMNTELGAKWLGLFHDLLPNATHFAVLFNPTDPSEEPFAANAKTAAFANGWQVEILEAATIDDIDQAFVTIVEKRIQALLIAPGALFLDRRLQLASLALRHAVPAIYAIPAFPEAGGLMSYGSDWVGTFRQVGMYVGRILKGERPSELPVLQATKFEFVINLITAKVLGLAFPPGLLAIADRVIE